MSLLDMKRTVHVQLARQRPVVLTASLSDMNANVLYLRSKRPFSVRASVSWSTPIRDSLRSARDEPSRKSGSGLYDSGVLTHARIGRVEPGVWRFARLTPSGQFNSLNFCMRDAKGEPVPDRLVQYVAGQIEQQLQTFCEEFYMSIADQIELMKLRQMIVQAESDVSWRERRRCQLVEQATLTVETLRKIEAMRKGNNGTIRLELVDTALTVVRELQRLAVEKGK